MRLTLSEAITVGPPAHPFQVVAFADGVQLVALKQGSVKVNGVALDSHQLRDGDRIDCGNSAYLLRRTKGEWHLVDLDRDLPSQTDEGIEDALMALVDALDSLVGKRDYAGTLPLILETAARVLDADHGLLEIPGESAHRHYYPDESIAISTTAVERSLQRNEAILWNQDHPGSTLDLTKSIVANQLTSILVAPFPGEGQGVKRATGFLYLQRQARQKPFTARDCELFGRFTNLCARLAAEVVAAGELRHENEVLREVKDRNGLVYACESMEQVVALALRVSAVPVPVVIHGETGTGKEVLARFIHSNGPRAGKPFIAINCGAIPPTLVESILFGHVKGAFTGAAETRKGVFEEADAGTLFLDEIGELPIEMQVKLLRVLQEKKVTRVGDAKEFSVDVRVLSASHRNLDSLVGEGKFREDLFFRLSVMQLKLPPLRDRGQDILVLARRFLERFSAEFGMGLASFGKAAEKALLRHDWPGNVRELENRVQKGLVHSGGGAVAPADLGLDGETAGGRGLRTLHSAREAAERECVDRALRDARGNLTLAGQILGIDRKVLRELLERLGVEKEAYKRGATDSDA